MRILILAWVVACRGGNGGDNDTTLTDTGDITPVTTDSGTDTTPTADTGTAVVWSEESFQAPDAQQEDILFVVDNSCSMADNQVQMGASMQGFVDTLSDAGIDWHAGVTSTDVDAAYGTPLQGRLNQVGGDKWSSPVTADPAAWLEAAIQIGINGSGEEKGIAAAYLAAEVRRDTDNAGFLRDGAGLHVVVLSDEQDQSEHTRPSELISVDDFIDWLEDHREPNRSVSFSSIVCPAASGTDCTAFDVGTRYLDVTEAIGGIVWDINDDLSLGVNAIASAIITQAGFRTLELAEVPADPATLEVSIDGVLLDPAEWSYDADTNSVVLTDPAPDASDIVVRWPEA